MDCFTEDMMNDFQNNQDKDIDDFANEIENMSEEEDEGNIWIKINNQMNNKPWEIAKEIKKLININ